VVKTRVRATVDGDPGLARWWRTCLARHADIWAQRVRDQPGQDRPEPDHQRRISLASEGSSSRKGVLRCRGSPLGVIGSKPISSMHVGTGIGDQALWWE
jgi:hypothetical protein